MTAELTKFQIMELSAIRVIGKELRCKVNHPEGNLIPAFWDKCLRDGTIKGLEALRERLYPNTLVGWMGRYDPKDETYGYVVGVLARPETDPPVGMVGIDIPQTWFVVGTIRGMEPDIYIQAHPLVESEMKKGSLEFNQELGFKMEWYDERFCQNEGYNVIDLYVPAV